MGVHHFHKGCQVFRDSKYYCSHCGNESHQVEVNLKLHDPTKLSLQSRRPQRLSTVGSVHMLTFKLGPTRFSSRKLKKN